MVPLDTAIQQLRSRALKRAPKLKLLEIDEEKNDNLQGWQRPTNPSIPS